MIQTIWHEGKEYPEFQSNGNAARFCMPFALEVCKGLGFDVGCNRAEWSLPGSILVDHTLQDEYHAMNLPPLKVDYIFSSHMAEHFVGNIADMLDYWATKLKSGGVLFLYLPDYSQSYWRFWSNRKHIHTFTPEIMHDCLTSLGSFHKVFVSGVDAYNSFTVMAERI